MAKPRIPTKPNEVRDQLGQASKGIAGEPSWPTTAPTQMKVDSIQASLILAIDGVTALEAQLAKARTELHHWRDAGVTIMKNIDNVTDGLYGPEGDEKMNFGLPPKKTHGELHHLGQVVITKVQDGVAPASIFVDWDPEEGAGAYQIEWYSDAAMTQKVGNAAVTQSEFEIGGLTPGQQYWIRVRAVRGAEFAHWSDVATRVANL